MHGFSIFRRAGPLGNWRHSRWSGRRPCASGSTGAAQPPATGGPSNPLLKAALTSGSLSLAGDLLAQALTARITTDSGTPHKFELARMARMGTFGLFFYGPYQHHWYRLLERHWPRKTTAHFLTKVALNQVALAPVVLLAVFSWNLALQRRAADIPAKVRADLLPTMVNGWKFWVPASSINFWLIPVQQQVLYMSACGVLWTAYLSFSSNKKATSR